MLHDPTRLHSFINGPRATPPEHGTSRVPGYSLDPILNVPTRLHSFINHPCAPWGGIGVNTPRRRAYRGFHYYFRHWQGGTLGGRWSPRGLQAVCNVCSMYESTDLHSGPSTDNTPILRLPPECHRNFFSTTDAVFLRPNFVAEVSKNRLQSRAPR